MQAEFFTVTYLRYFFEKEAITRVLFGLKAQNLCNGKWVGLGGKVLPGETLAQGALREIREEVPGITVRDQSLRLRVLLEVVGAPTKFVFVLIGEASGGLIPWGSTEFHHFGWWSMDALPSREQLPEEDSLWLPAMLQETSPPQYVRVTPGDYVEVSSDATLPLRYKPYEYRPGG